jgi:hypothetical protein
MQKKCPEGDIVVFGHSLIAFEPSTKGIHIIRDPRDIIISGYQYHKRTKEGWCINKDFAIDIPIKFPQVPRCRQHEPEEWKTHYIESLKGKSYQGNLRDKSVEDGIIFEMNNYGAWTIDTISKWDYCNPNVLEVKFENVIENFNHTITEIFNHLGFPQGAINNMVSTLSAHDINRMSADEIRRNRHITSANTSRWKKHFTGRVKKEFKERFGRVLIKLGYERNNKW